MLTGWPEIGIGLVCLFLVGFKLLRIGGSGVKGERVEGMYPAVGFRE